MRNNKGVTLVELLIASALLLLATTAIYNIYIHTTNSFSRTAIKDKDRSDAAFAIKIMERDIRELESSSTFEAIALATTNDIIFYSDYDNDDVPEKIEYVLTNGILYGKITQPDSNNPPYTYNGAPITKTIAQNITNNQIFSYFSGYETALTSLPLSAAERQKVKLIKLDITIDSSGSDEPPPTALEDEVNLRNQND